METDPHWLNWPRADGAAPLRGVQRRTPDDFKVTELADPPVCAAGEHRYLYVEKRERTTAEVAAQLARAFGVSTRDVGYAGMKDRRAVTRQWFSVPADDRPAPDLPDLSVLNQRRCARKLRRGELEGNGFELRLHGVSGADAAARLAQLAAQGVPNYFGPQRFGHDNLVQARAWLPRRRRERDAFRRGLYLSVLRAYLFNSVLAARLKDGTWNRCLHGETEPTGPLWGRGRPAVNEALAALELRLLDDERELLDGLEHAGLQQQRRPLVLKPRAFEWCQEAADVLYLRFSLPPGGYASSVLRELGEFSTPADTDDD